MFYKLFSFFALGCDVDENAAIFTTDYDTSNQAG